ncbi:MAG: recombinase family protein [Clostridia bacterium]|nr:recombinase family protein [Clostridia bacterium]
MTKKVRIIPPTIDRYTSSPIDDPRLRRVAAYARVSTDMLEQITSYEAQIDYYTKYIKEHEGWEFVKVYTDEGITGTSTKKRDGFNEMIRDALDGKIDLIVTKSVSRFARNTVDSLTTIQKLRDHNVECYFEKENVYTFDSKGDLLLTFMSGLAQEEARNISENTTWGQRKRFADGDVTLAYSRFLGYDKGADGKLVINEEQAALVRRIYKMYLHGYSFSGIARKFTEEGIPTVTGKKQWHDNNIKSILTNEKYKGDALLQKSYTVDFLTKKVKKNNGEVQQYYIENDHEAIIPADTFDAVQRLVESGRNGINNRNSKYVLSGKVFCGECGSVFGSKVWHSNDKYRRKIWRCNGQFKNKRKCTTPHFTEDELKDAFVGAVNKLLPMREQLRAEFKASEALYNTAELQEALEQMEEKLDELTEKMNSYIERNARLACDQTVFKAEYAMLERKYRDIKHKVDATADEIARRRITKSRISDILQMLDGMETEITEFDNELFIMLVDRITVYAKDDVRVRFINGTEIRVDMEM